MESSKTNMENRETKFKELVDEFDSLLSEYKDVWFRIRKIEWGDVIDKEKKELFSKGSNLRERLRVLGEKIFASTDSDKAKLNIVYNFGFAGIEPGPLVAKFMKKQKEKNEGGDE